MTLLLSLHHAYTTWRTRRWLKAQYRAIRALRRCK